MTGDRHVRFGESRAGVRFPPLLAATERDNFLRDRRSGLRNLASASEPSEKNAQDTEEPVKAPVGSHNSITAEATRGRYAECHRT